jgi:hypothetical protein
MVAGHEAALLERIRSDPTTPAEQLQAAGALNVLSGSNRRDCSSRDAGQASLFDCLLRKAQTRIAVRDAAYYERVYTKSEGRSDRWPPVRPSGPGARRNPYRGDAPGSARW